MLYHVGATDPKQDILVGPTFADNHPEDLAAPAVAPAVATTKSPAEDTDHASSGEDSGDEVKEAPKKKRTKKKPARKSVTTPVEQSNKRRRTAHVSYANMGG